METGRLDGMSVRTLESIALALGARLHVTLSWNGEQLDRLLDADHAALVEVVARVLRGLGWDVVVEASFNVYGERGSIDVLAFHAASRTVLIVEVKSVVPDIQATIVTLDRKSRLARAVARERGWEAVSMGRLLVIADGRTSRRRVATHAATFDVAFPERGARVRRWLRDPAGLQPFSGLWFVPIARVVTARQRIRRPEAASRRPSRSTAT